MMRLQFTQCVIDDIMTPMKWKMEYTCCSSESRHAVLIIAMVGAVLYRYPRPNNQLGNAWDIMENYVTIYYNIIQENNDCHSLPRTIYVYVVAVGPIES